VGFLSSQEIIKSVKKQIGLDEKIHVVFAVWDKELGSLAKGARIEWIKNGQLIVKVSSSAHLQELTLMRKSLIKKINQYFGKEKVVKYIKLNLSDNIGGK
jgi:predicted nucleic acid-binding Zn ribbon protein